MSEIRVNKIQGTSGTDTAITLSGANATLGGTLAVTGVHTIGNNAVVTTEGGAATQNVSQGMLKAWCNFNQASVNDSFNVGSVTDNGTGDYAIVFTNNMNNVHACGAGLGVHDAGSYTRISSSVPPASSNVNAVVEPSPEKTDAALGVTNLSTVGLPI